MHGWIKVFFFGFLVVVGTARAEPIATQAERDALRNALGEMERAAPPMQALPRPAFANTRLRHYAERAAEGKFSGDLVDLTIRVGIKPWSDAMTARSEELAKQFDAERPVARTVAPSTHE